MLSIEAMGKNVEKAIESALLELKAPREDVDIKILEEGGLFKKAKVVVTISEDCREKYEKKEKKIEKITDEDEKLDIKSMFADLKEEKPKESNPEIKIEKEQKVEETKIKTDTKDLVKRTDRLNGIEFIKGLLKELSIEANVSIEENDETINISINGANSGDLIGYRGECLNAIQYIASIIEYDATQSRKRLVLDIENYRLRREESLKGLAHRIEEKVLKTNKSIKLEPMSANERRIIHTTLQEGDKVTTISKGIEPNRFIVILPKRTENTEETIQENIEENNEVKAEIDEINSTEE
ncbi:MAG: KH domain-containing protein [Clostridia bacterium]|nr:KH domain-containing protein [Clostridia bacterium]